MFFLQELFNCGPKLPLLVAVVSSSFLCCFGYFTIKGGVRSDRRRPESSHKILSFLLLFIGGIARPTSPSTTLCMPRATLPALLGGVKLVLGQCEIGTDHNRVAAGQVSVKRRHDISNCFSCSSLSLSLYRTYLRNWRNIEVQPLLSCFNVR